MELEIRQDRDDPVDAYRVHSQGRLLFRAQRSIYRSIRQETIVRSPTGEEVLRIDPHFYLIRPAYDVRWGERLLAFRMESWLQSVYSLAGGGEAYTIFAHRSLQPKYSIFVAGSQVAAIVRRPFSIRESDVFTVVYVEPAEPALLVAIALIFDRIGGSANNAFASYHGLATWFQARRFDESWLERHRERSARREAPSAAPDREHASADIW